MCPPRFLDGVDITRHASYIFLFRFCTWRGFKSKSNVCHVLCEELFMLSVTHSQIDVETEFGVVSLILLVHKFLFQ